MKKLKKGFAVAGICFFGVNSVWDCPAEYIFWWIPFEALMLAGLLFCTVTYLELKESEVDKDGTV